MKAQVQATVVIYVLAVVIAGSILLYGYTVVKNLLITQESVQLLDFKKQVEEQVDSLSYAYRDVRENNYVVPVKYTGLCFVDLETQNPADSIPDNYTLIKNSVSDGVKRNSFLVDGTRMGDAFLVGKVDIGDGFKCFPVVNGQIKLRFEALGKSVKISSW
jgi:hypothetical protein